MFNLPHIPTAQGLIDKAFRRGAKIAKAARSTSGPREKRMRKSDDRLILTTSRYHVMVVARLLSVGSLTELMPLVVTYGFRPLMMLV